MLKLLDAQDLLEHLIQLVLAEDELGGGAGCHSLLVLPGVLFASVDGVKLGYPGAQHCLFAQAVDLRQAAHPLLYVLLKNLPRVTGRAAAALHHPGHSVTFQEDLFVNQDLFFLTFKTFLIYICCMCKKLVVQSRSAFTFH